MGKSAISIDNIDYGKVYIFYVFLIFSWDNTSLFLWIFLNKRYVSRMLVLIIDKDLEKNGILFVFGYFRNRHYKIYNWKSSKFVK